MILLSPNNAGMSLLRFLQYSSLLSAMRGSPWLFPLIASIHLMGLALIGGSVLLVDLRLLGLGMRHQPLAQVARDCERSLLLVRKSDFLVADEPASFSDDLFTLPRT